MTNEHLISIVDDDPSMRDALVGLVRSLGYNVRAFPSAEEFLASCELEQFTCAITDIQMPGMNGFELQQQLSQRAGDMLVIMITARTEPDLEERAISSGVTCFLRKPFEAETLVGCLEKALGA
ncbi:response regulator transcription factor [Bradyrhizobium sp. Arg816]|uniref:response regulator transcription factor n=1 Tax=Bradyrhizobium sp. Arg816 TaxID=2998491 RepID=UPI00249E3D6C|nr:response regulator [Bradyrhizobium sp. Arg816]MDI3561905.1 response regulator [Bradyrhizobium sp. Arg816]